MWFYLQSTVFSGAEVHAEQQVWQWQPVRLQAAACLLGCEAGARPLHAAAALAVRPVVQGSVVGRGVGAAMLQLQIMHVGVMAGDVKTALLHAGSGCQSELAAQAHMTPYDCCTPARHHTLLQRECKCCSLVSSQATASS